MSYPGNPSLSTAVKDRVVSTFRQTVSLFKQGRNEEVASGCTLILQMDPLFDPARKLLDKARNPALPIDVDQLLPSAAGPDAMQQAREAMAARDFQRVVQITTEVLTDDLMNDEARVLSDEARDKMEAGPFVDQFVRKAEQHVSAGNPNAARAELEKARALDATHPEIIRLTRSLEAQAPAAPISFDATPSFIVDEPAAASPGAGRSTAQASDFGFTFEEEKGTPAPPPVPPAAPAASSGFGGFSFDTPAAAPSPFAPAASSDAPFANFSFDSPATGSASPGDFDFATAAINTSPDDQRKIEQYLADGDRAYEAADYQQAIDLWSRIFLIDVTNDSASERIERAKARRREIEQRVDTHVAAGIQAFERKDRERSRAEFAEALRLDPNQETARDYMERLAAAAALGSAADIPDVPYVAPEPVLDMFDEPEPDIGAPLMPPDEAEEAARPKKSAERTVPVPASKRALPITAIVGLLGFLVLAAGGWFAWNKFRGSADANPAATQALFAQASTLAKRGQYDRAIAVLQDVQPSDPQHDRALEMIADLQQRKSQGTQLIGGKKPDVYYGEQLALAQTALAAHDYVGAKAAYEQAMRVKPLPPELKSSYDAASQQVAKLGAAKALFAERKYPEAIANLQPLLEQDPQNRNIQRMISDAHFNLGAAALQEERIPDAIREFEEVLKVDPEDELARRSRDLAQRYDGQTKDLLYRIYVKYLPQRQAS